MANLIQIENFGSGIVLQSSSVAVDYSSGTALTPKNTTGMAGQLYLLVGRPGDESTELGLINSVTSGVVTLNATLNYAHQKYSEILLLAANQLRIYRAADVNNTVPLDGAFASIATVDISADSLTTLYDDVSGGSAYWYKYTYYNAASSNETALADAVAVRGGASNFYTSLFSIRREAGMLANSYISDVDLATYRSRAQSMVNSMISNNYTVPLVAPVSDVIEGATTLIAAGYLLQADYGVQAQGSSKDGQAKIDQGMAMLTDIQTGVTEIFDSLGNSLLITSISGWPDSTTAGLREFDDSGNRTAGGDSIFGISHRF